MRLQRSKTECPSLASSVLSKPNTLYVPKCSYWSKFKFRKPHRPNLTFWKVKSHWLANQVSRPQTSIKRTFGGGVAHWHSYWMNYVLKVTKSRISHRKTELWNTNQLDSWGMFCPGSSIWMPLRRSYLLLRSLVRSFTAKGICPHESGQVLSLNRRSISGLVLEKPVTHPANCTMYSRLQRYLATSIDVK